MAFSEQITEIRDITRTNSTTFTDADLYRKANIVYKNIVATIAQATGHRNSFVKQAYGNLVKADGLEIVGGVTPIGYNGEYPFPDGCIIPLRIETKFDEDSVLTTLYDQSQNELSEWDADDHSQFSESAPKARFIRDSILLRPLPELDVTGGLYWEYIGVPDDLDDGADVPDFLSLFHDVLTWGVIERYFNKNPNKYATDLINARNKYSDAEIKMIDFYTDRFSNKLKFTSNKEYQTESFN